MQCAFIGAGAVVDHYLDNFDSTSLELTAVCDRDGARARRLAEETDATAYSDLESLLATESAPLIVNLTSHQAHADVTRRCLDADRHVFTEKPLALDADTATALVDLAQQRGVGLDCAPINHRGQAQQHVESLLADDQLNPIRIGYAHAHAGRVTEWHDNPESFLAVGPLYDAAVYSLTLLTAWFGPVETVRTADAIDVYPAHAESTPERPTHVEATLTLAAGPVIRLTASFYTPHRSREFNSIELHGDGGSVYLSDSGALTAPAHSVRVGGQGRSYVTAPSVTSSQHRSHIAGPARFARAIERGERPVTGGQRGAHVVRVCNAIEYAAANDVSVSLSTPEVKLTSAEHGYRHTRSVRMLQQDTDISQSQTKFNDSDIIPHRHHSYRLPPVGFGCSRYRDGTYIDRIDSIATAIDAGYRLFDMAELYGNEYRIGSLLETPGTPSRDQLVLISKVWNTNHAHSAEACKGTLSELGIDTLDSYLLHWPDAWAYQGPLSKLATLSPEQQEQKAFPTDTSGDRAFADISIESAWRRLEEICYRGLTRTIGICNISAMQLQRILDMASIPPAIVQIESHPYRPRHKLIEKCHMNGIRVIAHSPLSAPGLLTEPALEAIAERHDVSPAAIAISYHVDRGVIPIPSSTTPQHISANLAAAKIQLSDKDRSQLQTLAGTDFER